MFPYFTVLSHDHYFIVGCIIIVKLYYTFIVGHKHLHFILLSDLDCIKSVLKHLLLHSIKIFSAPNNIKLFLHHFLLFNYLCILNKWKRK